MKTSYYKTLSPIRLSVLDLIPALDFDGCDPAGFFVSRVNTPLMTKSSEVVEFAVPSFTSKQDPSASTRLRSAKVSTAPTDKKW